MGEADQEEEVLAPKKRCCGSGEKATSPWNKKHGPPGGQAEAEAEVQGVLGCAFGYLEGKDPVGIEGKQGKTFGVQLGMSLQPRGLGC